MSTQIRRRNERLQWWVRPALAVALMVVSMGSSCQRPAPTSDSTPPILKWSVHNDATGQTQQFTGNASVTAQAGDSFTVTLIAEDPEGVHRIELGGSATWGCAQGDVGQNKIADYAGKVQELNPDSNGNVLTKIILIQNVDPSGWSCSSGFHYTGGSATLIGKGDNYFGGSTTRNLVITRN